MSLKILYGIENKYSDVSHIIISKQIYHIPPDDIERYNLFKTDPAFNQIKHIKVTDNKMNEIFIQQGETAKFIKDTSLTLSFKDQIYELPPYQERQSINEWYNLEGKFINNPKERLNTLHTYLKFNYGSLKEEYPEQLMILSYLSPESVVLELGSNIGRSSCVIASILDDNSNFVTLECDPISVDKLTVNRDLNDFKFKIENAALSRRQLVQNGWSTKPVNNDDHLNECLKNGWKKINTVTWTELQDKYKLKFDTLVADCEGALYYILLDEPNMLDTFHTIIIENDFTDINHKKKVDEILEKNGFKNIYTEPLNVPFPCGYCFFQVFRKFLLH